MTLEETKIAVIIPLYNDEPNIERAIDSALALTMPSGFQIEVLVVDDCSEDNGPEIVRARAETEPRLRFFQQAKNAGPSAARNRAVRETDAAWFTPLDSDDFMDKGRIETLVGCAIEHELDFVADNLLMSSEDAPTKIERVLWPHKPEGNVPLTASYFVNRSFGTELERSELGFIKPLIHRRALKERKLPYVDALRFGEDFELYTYLLLEGAKAMLIDPAGYYLVRRSGSASHSQAGRDHERLAKIVRGMLRRRNLSIEERASLLGHAKYSEREWAWWKMIEAVQNRNFGACFSALTISPSATVYVLGKLFKHGLVRRKARQTEAQVW